MSLLIHQTSHVRHRAIDHDIDRVFICDRHSAW